MVLVSIICPNCKLTKEVSEERIPKSSVKVTCNKCRNQFVYPPEIEATLPPLTYTEPILDSPQHNTESHILAVKSEDADIVPQVKREGVFYKIESCRVSLREYWWGCKGNPFTFLIVLLLKILRVRVPSSSDDPNVESLIPFEITHDQLPGDVQAHIQPLMAEFQTLGFHSPVFHFIRDGLHNTKTCLVTYRSCDENALGRVHLRLWSMLYPEKVTVYPEIITTFNGGTFLWSLASKSDMTAPSCCKINRIQGASVSELHIP